MTLRISLGAVLLLGLAAAAGPARLALAEPTEPAKRAMGAFRSPAAGQRLIAGASARVLWDRPSQAASEAREIELLLSIDGGRTFPIRITPDLGPGTDAILLRVPALPTRAARLAVRAGKDQDPGDETIEIVSDLFEIAEDPGPAAEPVRWIRGEWRTGAALHERTCLPAGADLGPDAPGELRALAVFETASDAPRAVRPERSNAPSLEGTPDAPPAPRQGLPSARLRPSFILRP